MITLQTAIGIAYVLLAIFWQVQREINKATVRRINELEKDRRLVKKLASEETKRKIKHTQLFENLTDPDKIVDEMERGADIHEARQAKRLMMPRTDAGSPAIVRRPRFIGRKASYWKPPPD